MARLSVIPCRDANIRVGILGGSFNPAHTGHCHISLEAIKRLHLSYVVWLVSPQNPLKALNIKASLDQRVTFAKSVACSRKIIVSDIERHFPDCYTANSIARIMEMHPKTEFMWIMGADNMLQIHKWYRWWRIFELLPVVVFDRGEHIQNLRNSKAGAMYSASSIISGSNAYSNDDAGAAKHTDWYFLKIKKEYSSSSQLRSVLQCETK
ncbi:nicotinate-nicotinamide nucleotide adenylyltransferase [Rickettsiales endosymbiont of Peranema trichophorum]|uniref:nicotinate-nucleotide adenylyltransferase n=1 Tax=Rickettsiales endosymbiont of Peranema trichophorum TaxID=2486577 RepID=UPI001023CDBA|nr:nicotinate-nucleotide adenylyltransferase [Rickettsiales endosymbiont of Peranema trichophorum]RZI46027.1 nicotinate-nicotinamide nucleotide adenylyltransferase [Rickettsiales endosymbiont of Peranema trichophorum]